MYIFFFGNKPIRTDTYKKIPENRSIFRVSNLIVDFCLSTFFIRIELSVIYVIKMFNFMVTGCDCQQIKRGKKCNCYESILINFFLFAG
jgi:hypothetical protein